ncbi:RluA family pseudouridine synthase [Eisenibacter elegans]|uniref:RluA family pseudouridine synthase n=1 Tax=Eisenibacter elegans TaxID=997 RepID=UPI0009D71AFA|nr:RluA family pseudouridine synthase [Eisenibacter elegans]
MNNTRDIPAADEWLDVDGVATLDEEHEGLFEHHRIRADKGQGLIRIDKFLTEKLANASRNKVQAAIKLGFVQVNGQGIKANYRIKPLDEIVVALPQPPRDNEIIPEDIVLEVVHEDEEVLLINKPAGMVVHPAYANWTGTLVNALAHRYRNLPPNGDGRPGIVHRIDKDTSGLLVVGKTEWALTHLGKQFYDHSIERTYYALVWGDVAQDKGTINAPLGRSPRDRRVIEVYPEGEGKHAVTHYEVLRRFGYVTLVACRLETGRTHQIRAHFKHIGHPLFADATYGGDKILKGTPFSKYKQFVDNCFALMPRQALHAKSLGFEHPTNGKKLYFETDLPDDFKAVLDKWEQYSHQSQTTGH